MYARHNYEWFVLLCGITTGKYFLEENDRVLSKLEIEWGLPLDKLSIKIEHKPVI